MKRVDCRLQRFNSLSCLYPDVSSEWHPTKNSSLTPDVVSFGSGKKVWWKCHYCENEWSATVLSRKNGAGCPYCSRKKVSMSTSLERSNPVLAQEWHPSKNGDLLPKDVLPNSNKKVWWKGGCGHIWQSTIQNRNRGAGCPFCSGRKVLSERSIAMVDPNLARQWHPNKNGELTQYDVLPFSMKRVWWNCEVGHEWESTVNNRSKGRGCPICAIKVKRGIPKLVRLQKDV